MQYYAPNHLLVDLTVLYPLNKFEAPSHIILRYILNYKFSLVNLQRAITFFLKKITRLSTHHPLSADQI